MWDSVGFDEGWSQAEQAAGWLAAVPWRPSWLQAGTSESESEGISDEAVNSMLGSAMLQQTRSVDLSEYFSYAEVTPQQRNFRNSLHGLEGAASLSGMSFMD
jgi:hypothetical protein